MEKVVIYIAYGELLLSQAKVFLNAKNLTLNALNNLDLYQLQSFLNKEQMEDLLARRNNVLQEIDNKLTDEHPIARWYYVELLNEVNVYINKIHREKMDEDLISNVLSRFDRDCRNTAGENLIIKTTLVEFFITKGLTNGNLELIKNELEQFDFEDLGNQLSNDEKMDLSMRIRKCISST